MKRVVVSILMIVVCLSLSGYTSVGQFSGVEVEVMEDYDSGYNTWNTIRLDDKFISLPCSVKLFTDLGYKVEKDIVDLAPNKMMSAIWFTDANGNVLELSVVNLNLNIMPVTDCYVYKVTWRAEYNGNIDVCGVGQGASPTEVQSVIGEPVHKGDGLYGSTMRMYETRNDDREVQVTYDTSDVAIEFTVICENPGLDGYQSQYESPIDAIRSTKPVERDYNRQSVNTTLLPDEENQYVSFSSIFLMAICICVCAVIIILIGIKVSSRRNRDVVTCFAASVDGRQGVQVEQVSGAAAREAG